MTRKKTKSQVRRLLKRAVARGEDYKPPEGWNDETGDDEQMEGKPADDNLAVKLAAAKALQKELTEIEGNTELKAKERRSAKRKAEAIAAEQSGLQASELLEWFASYEQDNGPSLKKQKTKMDVPSNPYIAFVGQLSFETTRDALFQHIKVQLGHEFKVTPDTVHVRLLTDKKTKKSRGMAFIEVKNPRLLYACLKLHHTLLDGRRINVERSAGGGRSNRHSKLEALRQEQEKFMDSTVDKLFEEYTSRGEIQQNELDGGVIRVCKRHSAAVVRGALEKYVESGGRDMDNPSAYMTFLLGKLAEEGIFQKEEKSAKNNGKSSRTKKSLSPAKQGKLQASRCIRASS